MGCEDGPTFAFRVRAPFGPMDWIVVSVVVRERTDGAGEEKVLSPPLRESKPPFAVRLVPVTDDAMCDGAFMERPPSWSVDTVGAMDIAPAVGGALPSPDERTEARLSAIMDGSEVRLLVWAVVSDGSLYVTG